MYSWGLNMRIASVVAVAALFYGPALVAEVTGTWSGEVELSNGQKLPFTAVLEQDGARVTGILAGINGAPDVEIINGRHDGNLVTFSGVRMIQGNPVNFDYYGVRAGSDMHFTIHRVGAEGPDALLSSMTRLGVPAAAAAPAVAAAPVQAASPPSARAPVSATDARAAPAPARAAAEPAPAAPAPPPAPARAEASPNFVQIVEVRAVSAGTTHFHAADGRVFVRANASRIYRWPEAPFEVEIQVNRFGTTYLKLPDSGPRIRVSTAD